MDQRSSDREAVEAEIERIRSLGLDALRSLWRTTFRSSAPKGFTKDLVARYICQHLFAGVRGRSTRPAGTSRRASAAELRAG
jgi:hypothetical protein